MVEAAMAVAAKAVVAAEVVDSEAEGWAVAAKAVVRLAASLPQSRHCS